MALAICLNIHYKALKCNRYIANGNTSQKSVNRKKKEANETNVQATDKKDRGRIESFGRHPPTPSHGHLRH
jgi:hypothetical protein